MLSALWMRITDFQSRVTGPVNVIRRFSPDLDAPIARDIQDRDGNRATVTEFDRGWRFATNHQHVFELFDVPGEELGGTALAFSAQLASHDLRGKAYLELWCHVPGKGEFFSKGVHTAISGSRSWRLVETSLRLRPGHNPDRIRLNLAVDGSGVVEIRDVTLSTQAVTKRPLWQQVVLVPGWLVWTAMRLTTLLVVNAVLLAISVALQAPDAITWWPRSSGPKVGKRSS